MSIKTYLNRNGYMFEFDSPTFHPDYAPFPVYLTGTVGFGLAPSHQLTARGPFQHGDTYVGFRLDPRILQLPIVVPASSAADMMYKRSILNAIFRTDTDLVTLRLTWDDPIATPVRAIDAHVVGGLTLDATGESFNIRTAVQLKANDPTWYDDAGGGVFEVISGTVAGSPTPYPKPYPVTYGATTINQSNSIIYYGTWDSYPIIQATGPITDLTIVDTMGHQIIVNSTIAAGDTWTFDLSYGAYTVTDSAGANRFSDLNINSNLVNWRIYANDATRQFSVNNISVSGTGTTSASRVTLFFYPRYIGA